MSPASSSTSPAPEAAVSSVASGHPLDPRDSSLPGTSGVPRPDITDILKKGDVNEFAAVVTLLVDHGVQEADAQAFVCNAVKAERSRTRFVESYGQNGFSRAKFWPVCVTAGARKCCKGWRKMTMSWSADSF